MFSVADLEAGLLFAQQASVALANAQLVAKLQDAKKEIEMLNDLMFHDINNYNFATLNYIEMIAKSPGVSDAHKAYLDKSLHLIRLNAKLIENVKKLTKIGGMKSEEFVQVDLSDVLRKVAAGVQNATPDKEVSISLKVPESGAHVMGNTLIDELFVNLFNNAVKYDPHPEVEIDVDMVRVLEDTKVCWKVCVADHGIGHPRRQEGEALPEVRSPEARLEDRRDGPRALDVQGARGQVRRAHLGRGPGPGPERPGRQVLRRVPGGQEERGCEGLSGGMS